MSSKLEGFGRSLVSVSTDEVLEQELRVCEITRIVFEGLPVASHKSFLEIGGVPDPLLHLLSTEKRFSFLDEFVSSHLNIFVEKVASKNLLAVFVVEQVGDEECESKSCLGHKLHVLVMEKDIVVVQEHQGSCAHIHHVLFVQRVFNVKISHVVVPLGIIWVEEHSVQWELRSNTLDNVEQVKHFFNRFISLLPHTSILKYQSLVIRLVLTCALASCHR